MNAIDFYKEFTCSMREDSKDENGRSFLELYKGDTKEFTNFINKKIIADIIRNNHIEISPEYFRVDVPGWVSKFDSVKDEAKKVGMNPHLWDLEIAVEHENSSADWTDELIKLVHINCPLRVVIGYNDSSKRKTDEDKLKYAAECIQKTKAFSSLAGELLVILGNCKGDYTQFDYRGYLFNPSNNRFEKIENN